MEKLILSATNSSQILKRELIQELWSGYGSLERVTTDKKSVILKLIKFPTASNQPRGWNSKKSHLRKEKSYLIETAWYEQYNQNTDLAYSPRLIASGEENGQRYILLEDLRSKGFVAKSSISKKEIKLCLKWLASFHHKYLGKQPKDLWQVGTYWHLETRPEELEALKDLKLKEAASFIDRKLNSAKNKTFVHGDAKLANFLFSAEAVAAVDFQYVGGGVGIKDLCYFLGSIFDEEELHKNAEQCIDIYFKELSNKEVETEWRELYPYAWCDFYRFLKGWSPAHHKINSYSKLMKEKVLKWI